MQSRAARATLPRCEGIVGLGVPRFGGTPSFLYRCRSESLLMRQTRAGLVDGVMRAEALVFQPLSAMQPGICHCIARCFDLDRMHQVGHAPALGGILEKILGRKFIARCHRQILFLPLSRFESGHQRKGVESSLRLRERRPHRCEHPFKTVAKMRAIRKLTATSRHS